MNFFFHPEAKKEFLESIDYYDKKSPNLGYAFSNEVYKSINQVQKSPVAFPKFSKHTRRIFIDRFPFAIIYQTVDDRINIVAIMHLSRKPGYWKKRRFR